MPEIGELLKELRIKKDLSIDDIQEITKIRSRYIQAIEEGNLDKLPGQFYAKAFIRTYAEVLDVDPKVLKEYNETLPKFDLDEAVIKHNHSSLASQPSKMSRWFIASLVYIFIALIFLFVYIFYVSYSSTPDDSIPGDPLGDRIEVYPQNIEPNNSNNNINIISNSDNKNSEQTEQQLKNDILINKIRTTTFKNRPLDEYEVIVSDGKEIEVKLQFTSKCWFDIKSGGQNGERLLMNTYDSGQETDSFILKDQMWIHLGNAVGVEIYIGSKKIKAGSENGPKYISIIKKQQ